MKELFIEIIGVGIISLVSIYTYKVLNSYYIRRSANADKDSRNPSF
jgi:hypothetical protein